LAGPKGSTGPFFPKIGERVENLNFQFQSEFPISNWGSVKFLNGEFSQGSPKLPRHFPEKNLPFFLSSPKIKGGIKRGNPPTPSQLQN
jgi:hypothetical protein